MATYLFITKPEYTPERVEAGQDVPWWSCSSTTRLDDKALVFVAGVGIQYEWRVLSDAAPHDEWKYICDVEHVRAFDPPISISEIRNSLTTEEWAPPYQNFRGLRSIKIPDEAVPRLLALRRESTANAYEVELPEEVPAGSKLIEGAVRQITINAYERNAEARRRCIDHYGAACHVCGFDFGEVYGPGAEGYIHVHHLTPLCDVGVEYEVDPVADMRPVCPNCHAVIHLGGELRSIEEVKNLLFAGKRRTNG